MQRRKNALLSVMQNRKGRRSEVERRPFVRAMLTCDAYLCARWNCSASVEPASAAVADWPLVTAMST
jgi:hypothetical protein